MDNSVITDSKKLTKMSSTTIVADMVIYVLVGLMVFTCLWPFLYIISMSISSPDAVVSGQVWTFPVGPLSFEAYKRVANVPYMWRSYLNTIIYVVSVCTLNLVVCGLTAYPLSIRGLRGRKFIVTYLLIPMFFGGGMIPTFIVMTTLGLFNNPLAIILPSALSIWNVILIRTFFVNSIPISLKEAAIIDGASDLTVMKSRSVFL